MTPRPNIRLTNELPVYALLREAERRKQTLVTHWSRIWDWVVAVIVVLVIGVALW